MMISVPAHRSRLTLTLLCDAALLLLFIAGVYQIKEKAGLDAVLSEKIGGVSVEETGSGSAVLRKGDRLLSFNGQAVSQVDETEFLCDALRAGDIVQLGIRRGGTRMMIMQPLTRFYSDRYIAVVITVGLIFFLLAVFVVWRRPEDDAAHLLHWAFLSIAAMIFLTFGRYTVEPSGLGHVVRLMFIGAYSFASPLFIHFTYLFPKKKWTQVNRLMWPLYAFILILTIATGILFLMATVPASLPNLAAFRRFMSLFDGCRWLMSLGVFFGIGNLVHSYRTENSTAARKKLRWTFLGMGLGPLGFILLWQTPQSLGMPALVPEELVLLTVGLTPIAMAISIVRYQILNIDIVLNRGTVYGLMFGIALLLYGAIVAVATALFTLVIGQANGVVPTAVAAVAIALLFEPIRLRVQRFVDRRFFRVHYDLQAAQNLFIAQIKETVSEEALAELVVSRADELLKPERAGFFKFSKPHARLELVAHRNFSENNRQSLRFDLARLTSALEKPIGQEDKLEQGLRFEPASGKLFHRLGIALALPLLSEKKELLGFWVLGEKKSGERFAAEDLSLLTSAAMHASLAIDRFHLQRELLLEKETSERLAELGEMKSFFVSSVSHELKTPLASIKLYAQLLQLPPTDAMPLPPETRSEYAEIIEGECDRLTRLVHSVLDFAKTERGLKTYHLTPQSLNGAVIHALKLMTYQFKMQNTVVTTALSEHHPTIAADRDALIEVLLNLLSNALKYSGAEKQITVRTEVLESGVVLAIDDNGIGIAAEDLTKIFEPFYRAAPSASAPAGGLGLGLALVKQIADAHHAILGVRSRIGIGSTFTVCFPTSQLSINLDQHA